MVRAIATGDIRLDQWLRTVRKELGVGITLGITMGLAGFMLGLLRGGLEIGIVVGLSMLVIAVMANLIGILLPFLLVHLRLDPAVASSPLITSVADVIGLIIYFSTATWILGILP